MKSQAAPQAPDPKQTAAAQTGTNVSTAIANAALGNVNQVTPNGNLTYSQSGSTKFRDPTSGAEYDIPTYTATTSLSPQQQAIADQNNATSLNLAKTGNSQSAFLEGYLGKPVDTSGIPKVQYQGGSTAGIQKQIAPTSGSVQYGFGDAGPITKTYGTDFSQGRTKVEDAMFSRLNPQIDRQREAEETRLMNQGIRVGSDAWKNAMADFNSGVNDQRTSIVLAGGQEQSRLVGLEAQRAAFENSAQGQTYDQLMGRTVLNNDAQGQEFGQNAQKGAFANAAQQQLFGQQMANAQFNNSARNQAISEAYAARNQPINEISALMGGSAVQNPNFVSTSMPSIPTVDYAGLVQQNYQSKMAAWQQQQASKQSMMGGLFGLGASAIMASDKRLKEDIQPMGKDPETGVDLYAYRYKGDPKSYPKVVGPMAQDLEKAQPGTTRKTVSGLMAVDLSKVKTRGNA